MRRWYRYHVNVLWLAALFGMTGCALPKPKPSTAPTRTGSVPHGSLLKPASQPPVFVVPPGLPEWQRRLLMDVNEQKSELERLYIFIQRELSVINSGQIINEFPDPLDLSEFYDLKATFAKELASLDARHRSAIYEFYGHLAQINTYLLQRDALPYQLYSNIPQRIQTIDQFMLTEIGVARSADFSWIK